MDLVKVKVEVRKKKRKKRKKSDSSSSSSSSDNDDKEDIWFLSLSIYTIYAWKEKKRRLTVVATFMRPYANIMMRATGWTNRCSPVPRTSSRSPRMVIQDQSLF